MNAYQKSQQLSLTGTDAEIVAMLQSLGARDIPSADVAAWMRERGLWLMTPDGSAGVLYDLYRSTGNADVKAGLSEWYASVLGGQSQFVRLTRVDIAQRVAGIVAVIATVLPDGESIGTELYAMAGGRPWADLTVEQFAAQRAEAEADAAREEAYDAVAQRVNDAIAAAATAKDNRATPTAIIAAAEAAWGA
jgi:hypothetical protein